MQFMGHNEAYLSHILTVYADDVYKGAGKPSKTIFILYQSLESKKVLEIKHEL